MWTEVNLYYFTFLLLLSADKWAYLDIGSTDSGTSVYADNFIKSHFYNIVLFQVQPFKD